MLGEVGAAVGEGQEDEGYPIPRPTEWDTVLTLC